jgi:hypothetical protein
VVEEHEVTKAWMKVVEVVAVIVEVKLPVSMGVQISGKCQDAVVGVFVCWEQVVKMIRVGGSVKWRQAEV